MSSSRMSLGGGGNGMFRDSSSRHNSRSSSVPRRMSYGCSPSLSQNSDDGGGGGEVKKDRRAMLEEWRKQVRDRENPALASHPSPVMPSSDEQDKKRARMEIHETPPLPPSAPPAAPPSVPLATTTTSSVAAASPTTTGMGVEGNSAMDRFRMRRAQRQMREQQKRLGYDENAPPTAQLPPQLPPHPPAASTSVPMQQQRSTICFDDDDDDTSEPYRGGGSRTMSSARSTPSRSGASRSGATPMLNRRLSLSVGASRKSTTRRKSVSVSKMSRRAAPLTHNDAGGLSEVHTERQPSAPFDSLSQELSQESNDSVDLVEGAGLRSRVQEMQQRITQLEKEKMALSMSKAPLEARFRQKEDAWLKDQQRQLQEIESLKAASKQGDERCRELEEQNESLEEQVRALRFDARKAASSLNAQENSVNSTWSRQLQNDRDVADLKDKLRHAQEEIKSLRLEKVSVESELSGTRMELDSLARNFDELQTEYEELEASKSKNSEAEIKLEVLTTEHIATSAQLNAVCADLAATKSSAQAAMEAKDDEFKKEIEKLKFEMDVLKARGGNLDDDDDHATIGDNVEDVAVLKARIEERDRRIAEVEMELLKGEQLRREMHNRIQELRGNIRVFVRTRPFLPGDGQTNQSCIDVLPDGESLSIVEQRSKKTLDFKFDKVFPPSSGQDGVFAEVSEFVQSALDGYNVCLFSYGQTGSGKTHTMQGSGNSAMRGIIPRAVEQILSQAKIMQSQKWQFTMSASFLEIYNENLRDLLMSFGQQQRPSSSSSSDRPSSAPKLAIKRDANRKSYVDGLTQIKIDTNDSQVGMEQLGSLMAAAARARSVATTKMNAQSSRSHSVFLLHLNGFNEDTGTIVEGSLNLCDLAGSERLDRSGAASDAKRLKETQSINKSLSCLGDVFNALGNGSSHVPFRNSKLTYLLQDCLSGDGKALMFVNLSPTVESGNESVCSLRFAQRVNAVELGKPTKHIQYNRKGG